VTNLPAAVVEWLKRHEVRVRCLYVGETCGPSTGCYGDAIAELSAILETVRAEARRNGAIDAMLGLEHDALTDMEGADGGEFERAEYVAGVARKRALLISAAKTEERWTKPAAAIRQRTEQETKE
jgi:hypothetical protein